MGNQSEAWLALSVIGLILLLLIPLPPFLLDALLCLSIVFSVMALLLTIYVENALEFSAFPSLLLFLTLFRLGLNIASTRMILTKGRAGDIIDTFGNFVIQGSPLVGLVLFALLTVINFVVVTKGAGRVAEVAARFTLEALPGKQMAIESDVSAGLFSQDDAKKQREKLEAETEFYGSMDGASKFVRGDAIAGILIIVINLIGGMLVGIGAHKLPLKECLYQFTRLTVGDGLVTQIPALLISVASGIIVTRASRGSLGKTLPKQIFHHSKVLTLAGCILLGLGFIPGMPLLVMAPISGALFLLSRTLNKKQKKEASSSHVKEESEDKILQVYSLELQLGVQLIEWAEHFHAQIPQMRREIASSLGIVVPAIHVSDNLQLSPKNYTIKIRGVKVDGRRATTLLDLQNHVKEIISQHAYELLNRQDVAKMVEKVRAFHPSIVDELIPSFLNLGQLLRILQNLLKEQIPIRDLSTILELLADQFPVKGEVDLSELTEHVRQGLARGISERFFGEEKIAHAILLDPKVEQMIKAAQAKGSLGLSTSLRPQTAQKIIETLNDQVKKAQVKGLKPVVLTEGYSRKPLKLLVEKEIPSLPILSYKEITSEIEVRSVGTLSSEVLL